MISLRWKLGALAVFLLTGTASAQIGPGPFVYFPTDNITDARFLGFGCPGTATFEQAVTIGLAVPVGTPSFTVSLFDGDTGKTDSTGRRHWDLGTRQISMSLYADPLRQLTTTPASLIGNWKGNDPNALSGPFWTASAASMPDNDWWGVTITPSAPAQAPSGNYFYTLVIQLDGACTTGESLESNLKIAASNPMAFLVPRFGIVAALRQTANDGPIVYPGPVFPPPGNNFIGAPTTYDGTFEFSFSLPPGEPDLRLYDGDFDHGTGGLTGQPSGTVLSPCVENDDLDTSADYSGFPFSTTGLSPEGAKGPGVPADDSTLDAFRRGEPGSPGRVGCVRYEVTDPNGTVYRNDNPSGSFEWEQFRIAGQLAFDPNDSDYVLPSDTLTPGIWKVRLIGLDMSNLNFFAADACSARTENGQLVALCPTVNPYLLGSTVWLDHNANGVLDPGEEGIPGATLGLYTPDVAPAVQTTTTGVVGSPNWDACKLHNTGNDLLGLNCFGVDTPGTYTVQVDPANFLPGGALYGLTSTTGNQITATLTDNNVLIFKFGYRYTGSIGDRLWIDTDGDGVQDSGEPSISGATVQLFNSSGLLATATTGTNGEYFFANLAPGAYTVTVNAATLPAGVAPTYDLDGTATPSSAVVTLGAGENRADVDFGYRGTAAIGDRIWNDYSADGVQDAWEPGINGVTVELLDGAGNVIATDTTSGDGSYWFSDLMPGTYTVRVVTGTLPANLAPTYDLDGLATAHQATFSLAPGATYAVVDFGYRTSTPPPGTGTIGYWKNHSEAWPVEQIQVGSVVYTKSEALALMSKASKGDKSIDLFKQLVATKLNLIIGNSATCISSTVASADAWQTTYPPGSGVKGTSAAWQVGGPLHNKLDDYNNGELCAEHRD